MIEDSIEVEFSIVEIALVKFCKFFSILKFTFLDKGSSSDNEIILLINNLFDKNIDRNKDQIAFLYCSFS